MARRPFSMLRACFWLLAIMITTAMVILAATAIGCGYMVLSGRSPPGTCVAVGVTAQLRELFSEALTAVLALLLAAKNTPPSDKDD